VFTKIKQAQKYYLLKNTFNKNLKIKVKLCYNEVN